MDKAFQVKNSQNFLRIIKKAPCTIIHYNCPLILPILCVQKQFLLMSKWLSLVTMWLLQNWHTALPAQLEAYKHESRFWKAFKVEAEFDYETAITSEILLKYAGLIKKNIVSNGFLPFDVRYTKLVFVAQNFERYCSIVRICSTFNRAKNTYFHQSGWGFRHGKRSKLLVYK